MSEPTEGNGGVHQHSAHPIYAELHDSDDFVELRRRFRNFVFPATLVFMGWYLLYVIMSNWAGGFMGTQVIGNINVALVFGLLQFVTTFGLAFLYSRYSNAKLDPLARSLNEDYEASVADADGKRR